MSRYKESPEYRELRCPCCGKPMQEMEVSDRFYDYEEGGLCTESHYKYRCKECNIKYDEEEGWTLPKEYEATITPKQINYLNILYNGFRGYDYDYYGNHVEVHFGNYVPEVLSKEFATRLIQDKLDEQQAWELKRKKKQEFDSCISSYGIPANRLYGESRDGSVGYGLDVCGSAIIIFRINPKTYELDLNNLEIKINDIEKFLSFNLQCCIDILTNLKYDLLNLKEKHDKL